MQTFFAPNFNFAQQAQIPGNYVAIGIAPGSEVDCCLVGNMLLGPMSLVPFHRDLKTVKGLRMRPNNAQPKDTDQVGGTLALLLYEACDALMPPGPRAPGIADGRIVSGQLGTTANTATTLFRIGFAGRRQGMFFISRVGNTADLNIIIRGIKYPQALLTRDVQIDAQIYSPYMDEVTDSLWAGTGARPQSSSILDLGQTIANPLLGRTIQVGGVDNQEAYDELECLVWGVQDANSHVYGHVEVFGERVA